MPNNINFIHHFTNYAFHSTFFILHFYKPANPIPNHNIINTRRKAADINFADGHHLSGGVHLKYFNSLNRIYFYWGGLGGGREIEGKFQSIFGI